MHERFPVSEEEKIDFMRHRMDPEVRGIHRMRAIYGDGIKKCGDCTHYSAILNGLSTCTRYDGPAVER